MNTGKRPVAYARHTWQESLDLPGAFQMRHLKNLILSRPFFSRIPDQSLLLVTGQKLIASDDKGSNHVQVTRDGSSGKMDATYIMAYTPVGQGVHINTAVIGGKRLCVWWYDPRNGAAIPQGEYDNKGSFAAEWSKLPWHQGAGPDWVLVIDDREKGYPPPGSR